MELVLGEERKPVDALLLIVPELGFDRNRDRVRFNLAPVEQLIEKLALAGPLCEQFVREAWRVGDASLERDHLDEGGKGARRREPDVVVRIAHPAENRNDHEEDVGKCLAVERSDEVCGRTWRRKMSTLSLGRSSGKGALTRDKLDRALALDD